MLYNISYLWNRFVAMETTLLIACSYTFAFVFGNVLLLLASKEKNTSKFAEDNQLKFQYFVQSSNGHDILHVILQEKITSGRTEVA